jgi:hypothetical protein
VFEGSGKDFGFQKELIRVIEFVRLEDFAGKDRAGTTIRQGICPGHSLRLSGFAILIPYHFARLYSRTLASAERPISLPS